MDYLLLYDYCADYLERRGAFRDEHLSLAWDSSSRGELVLAGTVGDPPDGAVFHFRGETPAVAEEFAKGDPYVRNGLVLAWHVRPWTTVVGAEARTPVLPARAKA